MDIDIFDGVERVIEKAIGRLRELTGDEVRVWRYVESQKALFGFLATENDIPTVDPSGEPRHFRDFVAFLRNSPVIAGGTGAVITATSFLDVRPEDNELPEARPGARVGVLLKVPSDSITKDNLLGVVWFNDSHGNDREEIASQMAVIREHLHTFSLLKFYKGFHDAHEFIRTGGESALKAITEKTVEAHLKTLIKKLDAVESTVSIYVRRIDREPGAIPDRGDHQPELSTPLIAGDGDLYELLDEVEAPLKQASREQRLEYYRSMFGLHAYKDLEKQTGNEGVFFPGGGDADDFDKHKGWLESAQKSLAEDAAKNPKLKWSGKMIEKGSFGAFPIRWSSKGIPGPLVGLLCVASADNRYFFTWTRRLILEQFCHWLGSQHSDLTPFLDSVNQDRPTHEALMSSLDVLRRVAPPSILVAQPPNEQQCLAFVLSVDIRKSTDLMAKMVPAYAKQYGDVLVGLWNKMKKVVQEEYGVFDKFTGDGILAYFPDFFEASRKTAALRLLRAVERCHDAFLRTYPELWEALSAVPAMATPYDRQGGRVGLGIGLDFGAVRLVNVGTELTIVGAPVVYACRLASAAWGFTTLANYPCHRAFKLSGVLDDIHSKPVVIGIKHEEIQAYRITKRSWLRAPAWQLKEDGQKPWDDGWQSEKPVS